MFQVRNTISYCVWFYKLTLVKLISIYVPYLHCFIVAVLTLFGGIKIFNDSDILTTLLTELHLRSYNANSVTFAVGLRWGTFRIESFWNLRLTETRQNQIERDFPRMPISLQSGGGCSSSSNWARHSRWVIAATLLYRMSSCDSHTQLLQSVDAVCAAAAGMLAQLMHNRINLRPYSRNDSIVYVDYYTVVSSTMHVVNQAGSARLAMQLLLLFIIHLAGWVVLGVRPDGLVARWPRHPRRYSPLNMFTIIDLSRRFRRQSTCPTHAQWCTHLHEAFHHVT